MEALLVRHSAPVGRHGLLFAGGAAPAAVSGPAQGHQEDVFQHCDRGAGAVAAVLEQKTAQHAVQLLHHFAVCEYWFLMGLVCGINLKKYQVIFSCKTYIHCSNNLNFSKFIKN